MRVEVATNYKTGEIAYAAGILVDELVKTEIPGTQVWPYVSEVWIDHIRGKRPYASDLTAQGLRVGYRGYFDNISQMRFRGLDLILEEPKIIVSANEEVLSQVQLASVASTLRWVSSEYHLREDWPPQSLVFSKKVYAKNIIVFDSKDLERPNL